VIPPGPYFKDRERGEEEKGQGEEAEEEEEW